MFKKKKEKKKDPLTEDEYKRLVELEKQHGPHTGSGSRAFKFTKKKDSKRVHKLEISTPFAFQHVAQACPDDRISVHSSSSSINTEVKNESTSSKSSIGLSSSEKQRTYSHNSALNPLTPLISNHYIAQSYSPNTHSSQNNLNKKESGGPSVAGIYSKNADSCDSWSAVHTAVNRLPWKQSMSSLHSCQSTHDYPDPYNRCYPKENVFPKEIPVPPPDVAKLSAPKRYVTLKRRADRGFGFSLRRSTISERCQTRRTVLFAEPGVVGCGLLPGDRLLGIDDYDVEHAQQEHAVQKIKSAGSSVRLTVQPIPELTELSVRSPDGNGTYLLSDENIKDLSFQQSLLTKGKLLRAEDDVPDEEWENGEKLWLIHRAGIALCSVLPRDSPGSGSLPDGKAKVKLEQDGSVLIVDEACTEPANPASQDKCEDITHTTFLNESSSLHTLRQRYGGKLIHTFCGNNLVTMNPRHQLAAYSDKVMSMFKGSVREELPPHIFAIAQSAYRKLMNTQRNQSIVPLGISGSGKSIMVEHCINYLMKMTTTQPGPNAVSFETFQAGWKLLEIFTCVETPAGRACSKDIKLFHLDFDKSGVLVSIEVQSALLDKNHVTSSVHDFSNFLALHMLAEGAQTELRKDLFMNEKTKTENRYLPQKNFNHERNSWGKQLEKTREHLEMLDAESSEIKYIWICLAAILHLGQTTAEKSSDGKRYQYVDPESGHRASCVLGILPERLQKYLFDSVNPAMSSSRINEGLAAIDALAEAIYCEVYQTIYHIINRKFRGRESGVHCISIGDFPGYQLGRHQSLSSLMYNYAQDRLLNLHDEKVFKDQLAHYDQEGLQLDLPSFDEHDTTKTVRIIDQQSQRRIGDGGIEGLAGDRKGIIWLLDEEALYPNSSAESFISKILTNFGTGRDPYILPSDSRTSFKVRHQLGYYETEYEASNWLKQSREALAQASGLLSLLNDSKKQVIKMCVASSASRGADFNRTGTIRRSAVGLGRRSISTIPSNKRKSPTLNSKLSIDLIMDKIKRSDVQWITCLSPTLNPEQSQLTEMPFLRMQLRGLRVIESGRLIKQGYHDYLSFDEFQRKFSCLVSGKVGINDYHTKTDITKIYAEALDLERSQHRIGRSKIFFRPGILAKLESRRDQKLDILLTRFQAKCTGYLTRKKIEKMRVQVIAVRCIQRNARSYFERKQWPWWKIFTQIIPLIETHKSELELKSSKSEIEELKAKLDQLQTEKDEYEEKAEKFEHKANELTHELLEEQNVSAEVSEQLEIETKERLQLKGELEQERERAKEFEKNFEKTDIEYAELRQRYNETLETMNAAAVQEDEESSQESNLEEIRAKYDHQLREVEYAKAKAIGELEEEIEVLKVKSRQEEKQRAELREELENKETDLSQARKRNQRLLAELHDTKLQVEDTLARNHELEKKQRKFDSEMYGQQAETTQHKIEKDKSLRDKEALQAQLLKAKNDLEQKNADLDFSTTRIERLEDEIKDQMSRDDEDGNALNQLKRNKRELEQQLEEFREELEESLSELERAEQARDRLQVQNERDRMHFKSELESKDFELEESRSTLQKRIKNLEIQLDDESNERKKIVEQRKEAEAKLMHLQHSIPTRNEETERKLRRDIQRYRALLKDAQTQIEVLRNDSVSKAQLKQLQAQLEEASAHRQLTTKSKNSIQFENKDLQNQIEEISVTKQEIERQLTESLRDRHDLCNRIEEQEDELEETMQKYKQLVETKNRDQSEMVKISTELEAIRTEKNTLSERVRSLQISNESYEHNYVDKSQLVRAEAKMREYETKLEFEKSATKRLESQNQRLKDQIEKLGKERDLNLNEKDREKSASKTAKKSLQEAREDLQDAKRKLSESRAKVVDMEAEITRLQSTNEALHQDLKLAFKRISDLQAAFEALEDSDVPLSDISSDENNDTLSIYSTNLPPVSRLGSISRLDTDRRG